MAVWCAVKSSARTLSGKAEVIFFPSPRGPQTQWDPPPPMLIGCGGDLFLFIGLFVSPSH